MIPAIQNALANPGLCTLAQSTTNSLLIETGLKAIGRPGFILLDGDIKPETKKYAAAKELLYQATCLAVYMLLVVPVFKRGAFKLAKNTLFKNEKVFEKFKSADDFLDYHKLTERSIEDRIKALNKTKYSSKFNDDIIKDLKENKEPEKYPLIKGAVELGNIIGSIFGLAILAPQVSHVVIHPALRLLGLEKKEPKNNTEQKIDTKA